MENSVNTGCSGWYLSQAPSRMIKSSGLIAHFGNSVNFCQDVREGWEKESCRLLELQEQQSDNGYIWSLVHMHANGYTWTKSGFLFSLRGQLTVYNYNPESPVHFLMILWGLCGSIAVMRKQAWSMHLTFPGIFYGDYKKQDFSQKRWWLPSGMEIERMGCPSSWRGQDKGILIAKKPVVMKMARVSTNLGTIPI